MAERNPPIQELMFEILKQVQGDIAEMRSELHLLREDGFATRSAIASLQVDMNAQGQRLLRLEDRMGRVEDLLKISDPTRGAQ